MRIMVTGAAGMLGREVARAYSRRGDDVVALTRNRLDITDLARVRKQVAEYRPEIVVNCAAYTNVDDAEAETERAYLVNGLGPRNLALACRENGASLVHISTDYVFSGRRRQACRVYDRPLPLNAYGASKLWGERAVRDITGACYILRTSWLFGPGGTNFVSSMLRLGKERGMLRVVDDQEGCPTYTADLARAVVDISATGCYGLYHVTNRGSTTWYRYAQEIFRLAGLKTDLIPCATRDFNRPANRPFFSVLDPFPLAETVGYLLPPWQDALARYLASGASAGAPPTSSANDH